MEARKMGSVWSIIWGVLLLIGFQCQQIEELLDKKEQKNNRQTVTKWLQKPALPEAESDDIFKQLDFELDVSNAERSQTPDDEKAESEKIFQELLEEMSTPKSLQKASKDVETINMITDSISRLVFRKGPSDSSNILGVLRTLLNFQNGFNGKR